MTVFRKTTKRCNNVTLNQIFDCLDTFGVIFSLSCVHFCLACSGQASSCFRTVAVRTTWQCKSCPRSRSGPDVCKCLRSIQRLSAEVSNMLMDAWPTDAEHLKMELQRTQADMCNPSATVDVMSVTVVRMTVARQSLNRAYSVSHQRKLRRHKLKGP